MTIESAISDSSAPPNARPAEQGRAIAFAAALADQGAQSLVNLVLSVAAARALGATDFGRFSIAFIILTVAWGFLRALITEPFIVTFAARPFAEAAHQAGSLARLLLAAVAPLALAAVVFAIATDGVWRSSAAFLAAVLPLIVVLEAARAVNLAGQRNRALLATGTLWVVAFAITALVITATTTSLTPILVAYGAATLAAIALGAATIFAVHERTEGSNGPEGAAHMQPASILRLGAPLALEFLITAASVNLLVVVVAVVAGLDESAGLRGAMVLAGPITTLMGGLRLGALADATRYRSTWGDTRWGHYALRLASALLAIGGILLAAIVLLSRRYGETLLGDTWELTEPALLPFLVAALLTATHLTAASILRARELGERALFIRIITTPTAIAPALLGAVISGATGASLGFLIGVVIAAPIWLRAATQRASS